MKRKFQYIRELIDRYMITKYWKNIALMIVRAMEINYEKKDDQVSHERINKWFVNFIREFIPESEHEILRKEFFTLWQNGC